MGSNNTKCMKMFPIDKAVIKSLEEEVCRLALHDESVYSPYRNPFLIVEVIENLFPYMDFETQLTSRTVCKLWNRFSTPIMRQNSHISFRKSETNFAVSVFSKTIENSSPFPLSKATVSIPIKGPSEQAIEFFKKFGRHIEELTLCPSMTGSCVVFINFLISILENFCPNLKYLNLMKLHYISFRDISLPIKFRNLVNLKGLKFEIAESFLYSNPHFAVSFVSQLISRVPNLERLESNFNNSKYLFLSFYENFKASGVSKNLLELILDHAKLSNSRLDALNDIAFPKLKVLRVHSLQDNSVAERFVRFLTDLSPSLEKLVLDGDVGNQKFYFKVHQRSSIGLKIKFPLMEKLKIFEDRNVEGFQIGSIEFLKYFPNLEELVLEDFGVWAVCKAAPWRELFPERQDCRPSFSNIKKLNMNAIFRSYKTNLMSLKRMIKCLPQLVEFQTSISMQGDRKGFGEFLSILSTSEITRLTLFFRDSSILLNEMVAENFQEAIKAYLPSFKNLQKLELNLVDLPKGIKLRLSKETSSLGFCKVQNLTDLTLVGFELFEFGSKDEEEVVQTLVNKLASLYVMDVDNSTSD